MDSFADVRAYYYLTQYYCSSAMDQGRQSDSFEVRYTRTPLRQRTLS